MIKIADANHPKDRNVDEAPITSVIDPAIHDPMAIPVKLKQKSKSDNLKKNLITLKERPQSCF